MGRTEWIRLVEESRYSIERIAKMLGIHRKTVQNHLTKHRVFTRPTWRYRSRETWENILCQYETIPEWGASEGLSPRAARLAIFKRGLGYMFRAPGESKLRDMDRDDLREIYRDSGCKVYVVAEKLGVSRGAVTGELRRRGIEVVQHENVRLLADVPDDDVWAAYAANKYNCRLAGNQYGVSRSTFLTELRRRGLPVRGRNEVWV